ncbi:uncharacterized protein BKA55DRAFT_498491 [Fusarium redolens]|uniref:PRISE-like Rossmann-fold domain-containing protein n=1 Tax=Fusarium redolens TaxID=48865 RepID=A0A9P9R7Z8_FUSRE|nr:uncharacterized protein BKA55DRAFT_498491 [Fusarium redolens]KAH7269019.1 hypothetical protein BKA55DRAFT_498491 [Fusarium redolens]
MSKTALVFGASGVTGWSFVNEILNDYPEPNIWKRVHALTNRPLSLQQSQWPNDPRLNIVSGIDLLNGSQEELEAGIKSKVDKVEEITHAYYLAYKGDTDVKKEFEEAVAMWQRSVLAIDHLSPALEFMVLQTGGKTYGCHLLENHPTDYIHVPYAESQPRLKDPYHDTVFYYPQIDWVSEYVKDKKWSWCETRPDLIVGFVPNQNFCSLATAMGIYLSLWSRVHGEGAECPFPGSEKSWKALNNDCSSEMIARQTIRLSLSPSTEKGGAYNVADARAPNSWEKKWPILCGYFGLKGTGVTSNPPEMRKFIKDNIDVWHKLEKEKGLQTGHADSPKTFAGFEYYIMTLFDFDRQLDMSKMYGTGFKEQRDTLQAWGGVFDRMRKAKIIP